MKTFEPLSGFQIKFIATIRFKRLYISYFMTSWYNIHEKIISRATLLRNSCNDTLLAIFSLFAKVHFRRINFFFGKGGGSNI